MYFFLTHCKGKNTDRVKKIFTSYLISETEEVERPLPYDPFWDWLSGSWKQCVPIPRGRWLTWEEVGPQTRQSHGVNDSPGGPLPLGSQGFKHYPDGRILQNVCEHSLSAIDAGKRWAWSRPPTCPRSLLFSLFLSLPLHQLSHFVSCPYIFFPSLSFEFKTTTTTQW